MSSAQVSRGQHPAAGALGADAAQDQRAHAERIAHAHQRLGGQRHQRIGADHLLQRVDQPIDHGGIQADRDQVDEHLGVGGGLEQAAAPHQRAPQHVRVGQVAVVRHREAAELEIRVQRLHVAQDGVAGRGVAVVADRRGAGQRRDHPRVAEIVADQAQAAMRMEVVAVEADDAGRFLAAVLQRVQAERGHRGGVGHLPDAEDAALLVELVVAREVVADVRHRRRSAMRTLPIRDPASGPPPGPAGSRAAARPRVVSRPGGGGMTAAGGYSARQLLHHPAARRDRPAAAMRRFNTGSGQRSTGTTIPPRYRQG